MVCLVSPNSPILETSALSYVDILIPHLNPQLTQKVSAPHVFYLPKGYPAGDLVSKEGKHLECKLIY